ncbi:acetylglucosamine transferase [Polynucleobacter sp. AP-Kaivos-20-H2]|uniref:O-linked N-acetylglucosamine transferase, SPINDLY family protein n=1 Tax=Polynucleobacter sp. AP-Kaivos-20-H2 TaxID=2689104 RepID=UPI001C0B5F0B|nr:acetylglucosamine transferase [Polynucleobacter sp. AP-Kaivos-20-H2]MBU3603393.1 acetylglucosamine transferase [Polynucleobacter sp. AP-Kaivos-20-H2]
MSEQKKRYEELNEIALSFQNEGKYFESEPYLLESLSLEPNNYVALYSLGVAKTYQGELLQTLECFTVLVNLYPNVGMGFAALGKCLQDLGRLEDALAIYDQATQIDPSQSGVYHNKACALQILGRHKDSLLTLMQAAEVNPLDAVAHEGQGLLLSQFKEYERAALVFLNLLNIDKDAPYALGQLMNAKMHICDWEDYDAICATIFEGVDQGRKVCNPLAFMAISGSVDLAKKCATIFGEHKFLPNLKPMNAGKKYAHYKKRIGFISGDFREHPVGYLLIGAIEKFDRQKFELTGLFTGAKDGSVIYQRYASSFDHFFNCAVKTDVEIAQLVDLLEIDVLIDLSGYTADCRLGVLAHRPAPIQMTYLGYPGTLGLPYVDCLIADQNIAPPQYAGSYAEKLLYLPQCYLPRDASIQRPEKIATRAQYGLPEEGFIFCCFNHNYKITPQIFEVWIKLLQEVKSSCLWLMDLNETAKQNLIAYASKSIDPSRIIFAKRVPSIDEHLARYCLADLFLDTFPYNGHTTCSDALFAGLPVVTIRGESFASRVCSSLLSDLSLGELSAVSYDQYYEIALELALNEEKRTALNEHLKQKAVIDYWSAKSEVYASDLADLISSVI